MTDLDRLDALAAAATPGPWIRAWGSFAVHALTDDDVLQHQTDVDFAVALVNEWPTIRSLVAENKVLREALTELDAAWLWLARNHPKAIVAMPSYLFAAFGNARANLPYDVLNDPAALHHKDGA